PVWPKWPAHVHELCRRTERLSSERHSHQYAPQPPASPYRYGLMPANFTTLAHFSVSSAINVPNSVGVIGIGSALRPLIRALTCGSARPAAILLLSLSMIAAGVAPRRPIPLHTPPPRPPRKY